MGMPTWCFLAGWFLFAAFVCAGNRGAHRKRTPAPPPPVVFSPPLETVDDLLRDDELLTEMLAVEVDAFIADCLGETA